AVEAGMDALFQVITRVRAMRAEMGAAPKAKLDLHLQATDPELGRLLAEQETLLRFLARVESVTFGAAPEGARRDLVAGVEIGVAQGAAEAVERTPEEQGR